MRLPFKKILAPTDFSEPSYHALDMAVELAEHFNAELHLLHVVPPLHVVPVPVNVEIPLYEAEMREAAERSMEELMEQRIPQVADRVRQRRLGRPRRRDYQLPEGEGD
jgi:nucleotide-binding universal stress UspA family protein